MHQRTTVLVLAAFVLLVGLLLFVPDMSAQSGPTPVPIIGEPACYPATLCDGIPDPVIGEPANWQTPSGEIAPIVAAPPTATPLPPCIATAKVGGVRQRLEPWGRGIGFWGKGESITVKRLEVAHDGSQWLIYDHMALGDLEPVEVYSYRSSFVLSGECSTIAQ